MFAIFIQRCGSYAVQFTTRQRRLDHIACANRAFSRACANYCVQFIDKDDYLRSLTQFLEYTFDALLKLPAEHCTGNHAANIQGDDTLPSQGRWDIAFVDTTSQSFNDCRFTNSWLTNKYRIVLLATPKHGNHPAQFTLTSSSRVKLALGSFRREITAILIKGRGFTMFSLPLSGRSIDATSSRSGIVGIRSEAEWR